MKKEDTNQLEILAGNLDVDSDLISRFIASEWFRLALLGGLVGQGRWDEIDQLLKGLKEDRMSFWIDYFCAAMDEVTPPGEYDRLRILLEDNGIYDFPVFLQLHRRKGGAGDVDVLSEMALHFISGKVSSDGYYYRMSLLADYFRLGLNPVLVIEQMDLDAVEYLVGRLALEKVGRFEDLREALEFWQQHPREQAGEIEQYLAMRMSELVYYRRKKSYKTDPDGTVERYRISLERRFEWEKAHRASGMCEGGGSVALPAAIRGVCSMREMFVQMEQGEVLSALVSLRTAVLNDMSLGEVAFVMGERLTVLLEHQIASGEIQDEEYETTLEGVKSKIERLITSGYPHEVIGMINELERMMPGDGDVRRLKIMAGLLPPS